MTRSAFEQEMDHIISLCLRYSWSEREIVAALEKLRDRYAPILEKAQHDRTAQTV